MIKRYGSQECDQDWAMRRVEQEQGVQDTSQRHHNWQSEQDLAKLYVVVDD